MFLSSQWGLDQTAPTNEKSGIEKLGIQTTISRICFKWFVGHLQVVCECVFFNPHWMTLLVTPCVRGRFDHPCTREIVSSSVSVSRINPKTDPNCSWKLSFVNSMLLSIASTTNMKKSSDCVCGIKCLLVVCLSQCRPTSILTIIPWVFSPSR